MYTARLAYKIGHCTAYDLVIFHFDYTRTKTAVVVAAAVTTMVALDNQNQKAVLLLTNLQQMPMYLEHYLTFESQKRKKKRKFELK